MILTKHLALLLLIILSSFTAAILFFNPNSSITSSPTLAVDTNAVCGAPCSLQTGLGVATLEHECLAIDKFVDEKHCCIDKDCAPDGECRSGKCFVPHPFCPDINHDGIVDQNDIQTCNSLNPPDGCDSDGDGDVDAFDTQRLAFLTGSPSSNFPECPPTACGVRCSNFGGICCNSQCILWWQDNNNCQTCGNVCPAGTQCSLNVPGDYIQGASCKSTCDSQICAQFGAICCPGVNGCVAWWADDNNCGRCGIRCNPPEQCTLNTPGDISSGAQCRITITPPPP